MRVEVLGLRQLLKQIIVPWQRVGKGYVFFTITAYNDRCFITILKVHPSYSREDHELQLGEGLLKNPLLPQYKNGAHNGSGQAGSQPFKHTWPCAGRPLKPTWP
jgi:hypothetical protein